MLLWDVFIYNGYQTICLSLLLGFLDKSKECGSINVVVWYAWYNLVPHVSGAILSPPTFPKLLKFLSALAFVYVVGPPFLALHSRHGALYPWR